MSVERQGRMVVHNGRLVPFEDAGVAANAVALNYAALVFEGVRGYLAPDTGEIVLFRLGDHLKRLAFSMRLLRLDGPPDVEEIGRAAVEAVAANGFRDDCYLRINAYVAGGGGATTTSPAAWTVLPRLRPRSPAFHEGRHFCVSTWRRMADNAIPPRVKSAANYMNARLAGLEAEERGFDGPIILTERGTVAEGPSGCIFMVRDGTLLTPTLTSGVLESITRATLLELAQEHGIANEVRDIDRTELYLADELFYCGTGQEITPILTVDRFAVGDGRPGALTHRLQTLYDDVVRGRVADRRDWLTPVRGLTASR
jgi:branched-chain amino acid aminotransferase